MYGGGGIGATIYEVNVNALKDDGGTYAADFRNILNANPTVYKNRKDVRKELKHIWMILMKHLRKSRRAPSKTW